MNAIGNSRLGHALKLAAAIGCAGLAACASAPHDTLMFKGIVLSRMGSLNDLLTHLVKASDGSFHALKTKESFEPGSCVAVFTTAARAKDPGYVPLNEMTIVPSTGCVE